MTLKADDRIYETSITTGTGTYTLDGAQTGFQAFSSIGANNDCYYVATDDTNWEIGVGTYLSGPDRLQRTTIISSSNADAAVNWTTGTRKLRCALPAAFGAGPDRSLSKSVAGSSNVTLTQDEMSRKILVFTGALTGNISVLVDTTVREWTVHNNTSGGYTLTFKTSSGNGIVVTQGKTTRLRCDGTDVVAAIDMLASLVVTDAKNTQNALTCYLLPSMNDGWRGIYRAGFDWWSRNQQWGGPWGGEMLDAATGTLYRTEFATGYIDSSSSVTSTETAGHTYSSTGFKVPETQTVTAVWLKLYKVGNPTNNLGVFIYSDTSGSPNALVTNGTATAQSGKLHTSDSNGQWYRFVFPTPPSLTGGTQYHIVWKSSGAVDASNYWRVIAMSSPRYPWGFFNYGDATPTWTQFSTVACCFLVELSATAQTLQASGTFDGKLAFGGSGASGTLSMSRGLCSSVPLLNLLDPTENTGYLVGAALTKDATILDAGYGEDHDRIVIRSNVTTGYAQIDVYESDGTKTTVTATATDLSSGTHSVGWYVRAKNDGADRIDLFVDGTTYSSATNLSLDFDKCMGLLGTMWVGGGFAVAPTDTQKLTMASLPSANGWTWTGTGTEANCMSIQGGKLLQNKNGYGSTDTGYYAKTVTLSNANGWSVREKKRIVSSTNTRNDYSSTLQIEDGTKLHRQTFNEHYRFCDSGAAAGAGSQVVFADFKSMEVTHHVMAKGSDGLELINRRLSCDNTGLITTTSASNQIYFGDNTNTAGENADVEYSYVAYYETAWNAPQFTGGSISELAIWQGNMKALWPLLYNSGSRVSGKALMGVEWNYLDKSDRIPPIATRAVTFRPTTMATATGGTFIANSEMERFVMGSDLRINADTRMWNSGATGECQLHVAVDGVTAVTAPNGAGGFDYLTGAVGVYGSGATMRRTFKTMLGLHKVEGRMRVDGGTGTVDARTLSIEARP